MKTWRPVAILVCLLIGGLLTLSACAQEGQTTASVWPSASVPAGMMLPDGTMTNGLLPVDHGEQS